MRASTTTSRTLDAATSGSLRTWGLLGFFLMLAGGCGDTPELDDDDFAYQTKAERKDANAQIAVDAAGDAKVADTGAAADAQGKDPVDAQSFDVSTGGPDVADATGPVDTAQADVQADAGADAATDAATDAETDAVDSAGGATMTDVMVAPDTVENDIGAAADTAATVDAGVSADTNVQSDAGGSVDAGKTCTPTDCDDANICTVESCDAGGKCGSAPAKDGVSCGTGKVCAKGVCIVADKCKVNKDCDDKDPCTIDTCAGTPKKCTNKPADGAACDDGKKCTAKAACKAGKCQKIETKKCAQDGNPCTASGCNEQTGKCATSNLQVGTKCDDKNPCTANDRCNGSKCAGQDNGVYTLSGTGQLGHTDGDKSKATFNRPIGIAHDAAGKRYFVSDAGSHLIRRVAYDGFAARYAGSPNQPGTTSGDRLKAKFRTPADLAWSAAKSALYVVDNGNHCIRRIDAGSGKVWSDPGACGAQPGYKEGKGNIARFNLPSGIALAADGKLYITDSGNHRIRVYNPSDNGTKWIAGSGSPTSKDGAASTATFWAPRGIAIDGAGNLFVAESGSHTIRRIAAKSHDVSTIAGTGKQGAGHGGAATQTALNGPIGIIVAGDGTIFFSELLNHRIGRLSKGVVSFVAGATGIGNTDGPLDIATFSQPAQLGWGRNGEIVFGSVIKRQIKRLVLPTIHCNDGNMCTLDTCDTAAGKCTSKPAFAGVVCDDGSACTTGEACNAGACKPAKTTVCAAKPCMTASCDASKGCVYKSATGAACDDGKPCTSNTVCDAKGACGGGKATDCNDGDACGTDTCLTGIGCVSTPVAAKAGTSCDDGSVCTTGTLCEAGICRPARTVSTFLGSGSVSWKAGKGTAASIGRVTSVEMGPDGLLYVVAESPSHVLRADKEGNVTRYIGTGSDGLKDGSLASAMMRNPHDVVWKKDGTLYLADSNNHRIRKVSGGSLVTVAGSGSTGPGKGGFKNGAALSARFYHPYGMVVRKDQTIAISDDKTYRIRLLSADDKTVSTLAGTGASGTKDGPAASAQLNRPNGLAMTDDGTLWWFEGGSFLFRKLTTDGKVVTVAGKTGTQANKDGVGSAANFMYSYGLSVHDGVFYMGSYHGHTVRTISTWGLVTTIAGTGSAGHTNGAAAKARFTNPYDTAIGFGGDLFVADYKNARVRRIALTGVKDCDDKNPCTVDSCDKKTGKCAHSNAADGTACGAGKVCKSGACASK